MHVQVLAIIGPSDVDAFGDTTSTAYVRRCRLAVERCVLGIERLRLDVRVPFCVCTTRQCGMTAVLLQYLSGSVCVALAFVALAFVASAFVARTF